MAVSANHPSNASPAAPLEQLAAVQADALPTVGEEVHATLSVLMPWGISVLFHAALVLFAVFIVWSTVIGPRDEEVIVPIARLSATPGAPLQMTRTERVRTTTRSTQRRLTPLRQQPNLMDRKVDTEVKLIGMAGGAATPFSGLTASSEFNTTFMGTGGNARDIAFIIDASGSLLDTFPFVVQELRKSIQQLSARQRFTVVFFQGDDAIEVPPRGLKRATPENKQLVLNWLSQRRVQPRGGSSPVKAIRLALEYKPDLMYMLSDNITGAGRGQYEIDQQRLIDQIDQTNTTGTKINTIQFLYRDPLEEYGLPGTLKLIAERSGGIYKFVGSDDLNVE